MSHSRFMCKWSTSGPASEKNASVPIHAAYPNRHWARQRQKTRTCRLHTCAMSYLGQVAPAGKVGHVSTTLERCGAEVRLKIRHVFLSVAFKVDTRTTTSHTTPRVENMCIYIFFFHLNSTSHRTTHPVPSQVHEIPDTLDVRALIFPIFCFVSH